MKKKKLQVIAVLLLIALLVGCNNQASKKPTYVDGTIAWGNTIKSYYTLTGETKQMALSGSDYRVVSVSVSATEEGGIVAWKEDKYSYSEDASETSVGFHLASKYFGLSAVSGKEW